MRAKPILIALQVFLAHQAFAGDSLVGKTMSEAVTVLGIDMAQGSVITEPPAVSRGLSFILQQGVEIQLFIRRGQLPLTFNGGENLALYKDLEVIGFRKLVGGKVQCNGEVMWHYSCK